jgi:hypothetical protein
VIAQLQGNLKKTTKNTNVAFVNQNKKETKKGEDGTEEGEKEKRYAHWNFREQFGEQYL